MIWFYVYKTLSLYNGCFETVHINNQIILHFVNLWSKEVIENISYPSTVNQIDGYMDARIIPTPVRYTIPILGSSQDCMSVSLSICLSASQSLCIFVQLHVSLFDDQIARPVIACSACGRKPQGQTP